MSTVNDGQKKAMGDILAAMNRALSEDAPSAPSDFAASRSAISAPVSTDEANVAAMRDIMARFRGATENMRETAQGDEVLMEALCTERTSTGVRISEWEITIEEQAGRAGKFYGVTREDIVIASNLRLYEAALLLTQELNRGSSITSPKVREILRLEEEFSKNLDDAARYARIAKTATGDKAMIAEARYSDARSKAISAKDQIKRVR